MSELNLVARMRMLAKGLYNSNPVSAERANAMASEMREIIKADEWTSVDDKLPDAMAFCNVSDLVDIYVDDGTEDGDRVTDCFYDQAKDQWFDDCGEDVDDLVTHWKPLPPKPTK